MLSFRLDSTVCAAFACSLGVSGNRQSAAVEEITKQGGIKLLTFAMS